MSHGGPIRVILGRVMGLPAERLFEIEVPYASLARVRVDEAGVPVLAWRRDAA